MKSFLRRCLLGCIAQVIFISTTFAAFLPISNRTAAAPISPRYLRLQLIKDAVNTDDIIIQFDSIATANYNADEDAKYLPGFGQQHLFSYSADNIPLAINVLPLPKQYPDIIRLDVWAQSSGSYQLYMNQINNIPKMYDIWLMDKYSTDSLDMRQNNTYSFNLDKNDSASYGAHRFTLVIRQNPGHAYKLLQFNASKAGHSKQVQLSWITANEENSTHFIVERSNNSGTSYKDLYEIRSSGLGVYAVTDDTPARENVYRLKQQDPEDNITYSNPVAISFNDQNITKNTLSIFPNPVGNTINLSVGTPGMDNVTYNIKFINSSGLVVKEVTSPQPSWEGDISSLLPGVYYAQVLNNKTVALVGRKKFVKY